MNKSLNTSIRQDWNTPEVIINKVKQFGDIDLDPCSNDNSIVGAKRSFTVADNGLNQEWSGLVYMNPPYGREIGAWVAKASSEAASNNAEVIALLPARPDSRWFQDHVFNGANAICWWRGRLTFLGAPASAPFPSVVAYWGKNDIKFDDVFGSCGYSIVMCR